jgi:hypothetical protein
MGFLLHGDMLGFMEKKLTNSGPFREPADKHSIYTIKLAFIAQKNHYRYTFLKEGRRV